MTEVSGIDLSYVDESVRPQDDLFRHVNGRWLESVEIPADKARWGSFLMLAEQSEKAVHEIITAAQTAPEKSVERAFGDLYASFMAEESINARGIGPIRDQLARVAEISSISELVKTIGQLEREGVGGFYQLFVDNDPGDPQRYLVFLEQAGISLPDESYFHQEQFADIRTAFVTHIQTMFELAGLADAPARAQRVFDLETRIAAQHWDNVRSRDAQKTYNLESWPHLVELFDHATENKGVLVEWLSGLSVPEETFAEVVVRQPSFASGLAELFTPDRVGEWKDWLTWQVIHAAEPYLSSDFVEANFDFYGRTLTGTPQMRDRWKRAVSLVEGSMGEAVGRIYVEKHFPPTAKQAMDDLVSRLIEAYRQSIADLEWMGEETRARALDKLAKFTPKIGYPAVWRDYSSLVIDANDLMRNVRACIAFEFQRELDKIGKPIDRNEWFMTPQTVNAYYNPGFNEIVFPAAFLQYPFFSPERDAAANYGAVGAVIGHEIGHGFDDQGSTFDGDGRLNNWWTPDDRAAFEQRTAKLIDQYNGLSPEGLPGHYVNGALTIGENIGDLGGLGIAWKAYLLSLGGAEPPVIDGLTGAERFFLSWAQVWQQKSRDEEVIRLLAVDPHSPNEFRCNQIVRNIDVFYETFAVTEKDALWLAPEQRVTIW